MHSHDSGPSESAPADDTGFSRAPGTTRAAPDAGGSSFPVDSLWDACGPPVSRPAADPLLGRTLGDVTLVRFIAEGGMGRVYEGEQMNPRRSVAVKVMRPGLVSEEIVRRFHRETTLLGSLRHPWIAHVLSAGTFDLAGAQLPYFVMEYIPEATTLVEHARTRRLAVPAIIDLFRKVCEAVAHGHDQGIVHRDLKPNNVLVDAAGHPRIIDFGVARPIDAIGEITALTDSGRLIGTLQYMSPEQVAGRSADVDTRADVYALGVMLYELLAGAPPHDLKDTPLLEAVRIVHERRPPSLRSRNPAVPPPVAAIVMRCLATAPADRFADAGTVAAALGGEPARASRGLVERWWTMLPAVVRRRPALAAVTAAVLLAAVAFPALRPARAPTSRLPGFSVDGLTPEPAAVPVTAAAPAIETAAIGNVPAVDADLGGRRRQESMDQVTGMAIAVMLQPAVVVQSPDRFRFAIRDIHQVGADAFLVDDSGMRKWTDQFMFPRVSYWAPKANGREARLVYRFDFGGTARSIHLQCRSDCWDFSREPGGVGRGASALEVSRDGRNWITIENNVEPRRWGRGIAVDGDLPTPALGGRSLWLRVRCITEGAPVDGGYNVAQFGRTRPGTFEPVFELEAHLGPGDDEPHLTDTETP